MYMLYVHKNTLLLHVHCTFVTTVMVFTLVQHSILAIVTFFLNSPFLCWASSLKFSRVSTGFIFVGGLNGGATGGAFTSLLARVCVWNSLGGQKKSKKCTMKWVTLFNNTIFCGTQWNNVGNARGQIHVLTILDLTPSGSEQSGSTLLDFWNVFGDCPLLLWTGDLYLFSTP